jgi:Protein of unknown function (DUF1549)/Protein of unknown function (DUF1553)
MGLPWTPGPESAPAPAARPGPPPVDAKAKQFWSFRPVRRPKVPSVKGRAWVRNPIDAFILAKLEKAGLKPAPPASKTALLRRAYYDLIGLPPSPEAVRAFLADRSPSAYEKVVDRLLASPQYGERWARHWLDLVRYAETNSFERDDPKPFAWRYRDYVIRSLNDDKPYDRFVREQLAGDEVPPATPERLIATGYYRVGQWDDEPVDSLQARYDELDDVVTTTGQVFLGLTVNCARCHDHKLDPIPQKDYYQFLAFFQGMRAYGERSAESVAAWSLRPIAPAAERQRFERESTAYRQERLAVETELAGIERTVSGDFTPVEKQDFGDPGKRVAILRKRVPARLSETAFQRYLEVSRRWEEIKKSPPRGIDQALCVTEGGPAPVKTFVLLRGNAHAQADPVEPGFPSVLSPPAPLMTPPPGGLSCGRRLALASWIASARNPLTARVIVNRVWQYHFGRGIVRSPNNFGFQGTPPTHPELLDWLAATFVATKDEGRRTEDERRRTEVDRRRTEDERRTTKVERRTGARHSSSVIRHSSSPQPSTLNPQTALGWRLKALHRLIMLSSAYRMSSRGNAKALAKDPENDRFWRFNMRRLAAEEIRDSVLAVNGSLNPKMYGPSIYPAIPPEVLAGESIPGKGWPTSPPDEQARRSIYVHIKRSLTVPLLASFDGADTDFTCPVRFATTQPTQALGLLNSSFINRQAGVFAAYVHQQAGEDAAAEVRLALRRTLQREPAASEVARGVRFMAALRSQDQINAPEALRYFCLLALNLNEFVYLD